jgi:hypothetical protein
VLSFILLCGEFNLKFILQLVTRLDECGLILILILILIYLIKMYWFGLEVEILSRGDYFRFGSVFIKKSNQTEIFFLKKKTETGSNRPVSVRFGFFRAKTGSNRLGSVFSVLARFFPVLARFFRFGSFFFWFFSVSVRFGFLLIKPKLNRTGRFF